MVLGKLPGTAISTAQRRGISPNPISLAEAAGKLEVKSCVQVKITEIRSSTAKLFERKISPISSMTASFISAGESLPSCVAPLIALTAIGRVYAGLTGLRGNLLNVLSIKRDIGIT